MPHIQPVKRAGGRTKYRVRWADEDGVERSRTFEAEGDAREFYGAMTNPDIEVASAWVRPGWFVWVCVPCGIHLAYQDSQTRDGFARAHRISTGHETIRARGAL